MAPSIAQSVARTIRTIRPTDKVAMVTPPSLSAAGPPVPSQGRDADASDDDVAAVACVIDE